VDISTLLLDRTSAMRVLLRRWGVELGDVAGTDPCAKLATFGLRCEQGVGDWSELRACDRPALLLMFDESGVENYLALGELEGEQATFDVLDGSQQVALSQLDQAWEGDYLLVWQPPPMGNGVIGASASRDAVRWLRKLLSQVPELGVKDSGSGVFDQGLEEAVRRFQEQQGIAVDGIAGSRTLIRLHNAVAMPGIPRLSAEP
jgi:general secretion pathway protein A